MTITQITKFKTDDGAEFNTLGEAERYEASNELLQGAKEEFETLRDLAYEDFVDWLLDNYNVTKKETKS